MTGPRFLYVDDIPTPYRLGVFRRFAERFAGTFCLAFLAAGEPGREWSLGFGDLDAHVLPGRQWRPPRQRTPFSYKWNPGIADFARRFRPDVVAVSGYIHPSIQRLTHALRGWHVPYGMASESSHLQGRPSTIRWRTKRAILGPHLRGLRFGLPCGSQAEAFLRSLGARTQPMYRFPNTPDVDEVERSIASTRHPGEARAFLSSLGLPSEGRRVLFVGRLIPAKRPLDLIEAFGALPPVLLQASTLVFAGDGELRPLLEEKARALPAGRVQFVGWRQPEDVHRLMSCSDVMVLPSAHEPWGAVVNESMAAGTPVIASDRVGAAHDLIEPDVTGWRFPAGEVSALKECLRRALEILPVDPSIRARVAGVARRYGSDWAADNLRQAVEGAAS